MNRLFATVAAVALSSIPLAARAQPGATPPAPSTPGAPAADTTGGLSPEELAELRDIEENVLPRYAGAADKQERRMQAILLREYNRRLAQLNKRYASRLAAAEKEKKQRQLEAMALLEKFIKDHPSHPKYTPDAMYRLARLYLDEAEATAGADQNADYAKSLALWERIIREFPEYRQYPGTLYLYATYVGTRPTEDPAEARRSLQAYLSIVCYNKYKPMETPPEPPTREESMARIENKVLVNPYSDCEPHPLADDDLVLYAWVRGVGPAHFSTPGEMDEAIAAYSKGMKDDTTKLYDEALYMTAWSYYRRDFLPEAIELFDKSVVRYDKVKKAGGKPGLELREEALQYIAVSFTDPWEDEIETDPVKALERAEAFYKDRTNEPHVREVWKVLGNAFIDLGVGAYDQAIACYRKAISKPWDLNPENPLIHQRIVAALERKGDKSAADEERGILATRYAPCPPEHKLRRTAGDECGRWYEANETNRAAMEAQARIGERMLLLAAYNTHEEAIAAQKELEADPTNADLKQKTDDLYAKTIALYKSFLSQYPQSSEYYKYTYNLAEALFFSGQYMDRTLADGTVEEGAITHYEWIRDHRNLSEEYFADAVFKIVKAYEREEERELAANTPGLRKLDVPDLTALPKPIQPLPIPKLHKELQAAYDEYARLVNEPEQAPIMAFRAGLVSMAYLHLDDAVVRFNKVIDKFCGKEQSTLAKEGILTIYLARGDDANFRATNQKFINAKCGDAKAIAAAEEQNRKIDFRAADRLASTGDNQAAAEAFYRYYKSAPPDDDARAGALYNAAGLYQLAGKPKTAIFLFKEFSDRAVSKDPKNKVFRESPYRLPAMRLTAASYRDVYDYRTAAKIYLDVYKLATNPKRYGVKPPPPPKEGQPAPTFESIRRDALFNAAAFLELNRDAKEAVARYRAYHKLETDRRKKDRALWAIARIYRSTENLRELDRAYAAWRKAYGKDPGNQNDLIFTYFDLARQYAKRPGAANRKQADEYRQKTIQAWESVPKSVWANLARTAQGKVKVKQAAEWSGKYDLYFAEQYYQKQWKPTRITKRAKDGNAAKKLIKDLEKKALAAIDRWDALGKKYRPKDTFVTEFALANLARVGEIYLDYNEKVFTMPVPTAIQKLNKKYPDRGILALFEEELRKMLEKKGYRDTAKRQFEQVVEIATKAGISNKWVTYAKDQLNKEFQGNYPILTESLAEGTEEP